MINNNKPTYNRNYNSFNWINIINYPFSEDGLHVSYKYVNKDYYINVVGIFFSCSSVNSNILRRPRQFLQQHGEKYNYLGGDRDMFDR